MEYSGLISEKLKDTPVGKELCPKKLKDAPVQEEVCPQS